MLQQLATKLDFKKLTDDGTFEGYGSIFNNVDSGYDLVAPGAFRNTLMAKGASGVKMLFQHDPSSPIGVWEEIKEDDTGLYVKGKLLTKVQRGAETLELVRAGVMDGLSIGFRTVKSTWEDGVDYRILNEVDLWEVSVVTFPCNSRARIDSVKSVRDAEKLLRDAGLPANFAKLMAKHGYEEAARIIGKDRRDDGLPGIVIDPAAMFGI